MNRKRLAIALLLFAAGIFFSLFVPDWFEDPRELAQGSWEDRANHILLEVDATRVEWRVAGHHGKLPYEWLQTDSEPYRAKVTRDGQDYEADITFKGADTAIANFLVFEQLPSEAQRAIREMNKAAGRPEREIRFVFRRRKED